MRLVKRITAIVLVGVLVCGSTFAGSVNSGFDKVNNDNETNLSSGYNFVPANDEKVIEMLKESGVIDKNASNKEATIEMGKYIRNLEKNTFKNDGELKDKKERKEKIMMDKYMTSNIFKGNGNKLGQSKVLPSVVEESYDGAVISDNILAILIDFPDFKANDLTPEFTDMYYEDYTKEHYADVLFSTTGYEGPNGENFVSMKQFYEEQSGGSYTVNGAVAGWYTANEPAAYYGNNETDRARELVKEALIAVANDSTIDLSQFDQEDIFDLDGDGNFREPDGIIDHLMIFHASVGEEAGGGALGDDAIWSHSSNLGNLFALPGVEAEVDYWGGQMTSYAYTIQPADAAAGVCSHEYGHDLGLPDEYDTQYTGNGEAVSYWSIMASGSWAGAIGGTQPTGFSPWAKEFFQANMGGNWLNGIEVSLDELNEGNVIARLDQASTKGTNNDVVKINLPEKKNVLLSATSGENMYFSGKENDLQNFATGTIDLTNATTAELNFKAWYEIEEDWDYAGVFVEVDGDFVSIEGNITTIVDPNQQNPGFGITGHSNEWVDAKFDLSAYVGSELTYAIGYLTDAYVTEAGLYADDIEVTVDGNQVMFDDAEGEVQLTLEGFTIDNGISYTEHYYLLEWRNHEGVDKGLGNIKRGNSIMSFDPGLVVWYVDNAYDNNWVGNHPGQGYLGVVDADQSLNAWSDGELGATRYQIHDAAFSLDKPVKMLLDYKDINGTSMRDNKCKFNTEFDDSKSYMDSQLPDGGRDIPNYGLQIRVIGEANDRTVGEILIGN